MNEEPIIVAGPRTARKIHGGDSRRRALLLAAGGGGVLVLVLAFVFLASGGEPTVRVRRGDIIHSLVAVGRVESDQTIEIVPKITARIEKVHVDEGDEVRPDQLLVSLEDSMLRSSFEEAEQARDAAKARWDRIVKGTRAEEIDRAEAEVAEAGESLNLALAKLAEVLRGARPEEKEEAEAQLELAGAEVAFAEKEWKRAKKLSEEGVASDRELDEAKRRHDTAQAKLRQARARRNRVVNGATKEEKDQARAQVEVAKAKLDQAKAVLMRLKTGATEEERRAAEAELKRTEAVVDRLKNELDHTKLFSSIGGVVVRRYKEPSELAFPAMPKPILVLAALDDRIVRIEVMETDVYKVRVGQPATVTSDSYPGSRWSGKVTRISPTMGKKWLTSENPKEKTDVKILEVRIKTDERLRLPLNLPIEARIREVIRKDVLVLPARVVDPSGAVRLPGGETKKLRLGARDDAFVEVLSGLSEGDRVRADR